jgi:hypothetical protein
MFESILCQVTEYDPDVLESLIELAVEIARERREGRRRPSFARNSPPLILREKWLRENSLILHLNRNCPSRWLCRGKNSRYKDGTR